MKKLREKSHREKEERSNQLELARDKTAATKCAQEEATQHPYAARMDAIHKRGAGKRTHVANVRE